MENNSIAQLSCRICSELDCLMTSIFEEHDCLNVCEMLEQCGGMAVHQNDAYSKFLCKTCTAELLVAHNFRKKCQKVQNQMIQMFDGDPDSAICYDDGDDSDTYLNIEQLLGLLVDPMLKKENQDILIDAQVESIDRDLPDTTNNIMRNNLMELSSNGILEDNGSKIDNNIDLEKNDAMIVFDNQNTKFEKEAALIHDANDYIEFDPDNIIEEVMDEYEQPVEPNAIKNENDDPQDIIPTEYTVITYNCDVCGAYFLKSTTLKRHLINVHHSKENLICKKCKHCFTNFDIYQTHEANCHFDAEVLEKMEGKNKNCTCKYCGKKFNGFYALDAHVRMHTGEKPFQCDKCEKAFRTSGALSTHTKTHNRYNSKYACDLCGNIYSEKGNLRVHMRTHIGEKKHECIVCGKKFTRVDLLTLHRRTHTGETPYECKKCSRGFKQKCDLQKHMQIHMDNRRYKCNWCGEGFMHRIRLERHVKQHENNVRESSKNLKNFDKLSEIVMELELDKMTFFEDELRINCNSNDEDFNKIMEMID